MARARDRVAIGYVSPTEVSAFFHDSLLRLVSDDNRTRLVGLPIHLIWGPNIAEARNRIARMFLDGTDADWLLTLDADMTFAPTLIEDLLRHASRDRAPVVAGLYYGADDGVLFPQVYGMTQVDGRGRLIRATDVPDAQLVRVAATGSGCMLIHRSILERVQQAEAERGNTAWPWYQEGAIDGRPCSEDVTFCLRVSALGEPVHVATDVRLGHAKTALFTHRMFRQQRAAATTEEP